MMLEMVTVRAVVPLPETAAVPAAVPVVLSVTFPLASVTLSAPEYVAVYVTGPPLVALLDGALRETVGAAVS